MGMPGNGSSRGPNSGQRLHGDLSNGRPGSISLRLESGKAPAAIAPATGDHVPGTTRKRRTYTWTKEARDLVRAHVIEEGCRHKLITRLSEITGYPRRVCVRFAGQMGVDGNRSYRKWSEQEIAYLQQSHATRTPRQLAAKLNRPESSIRAMMSRLGIYLRVEKDRFTKYTLASLVHVRPKVIQDWIDQGWLKAHREGTEKLPRLIIKARDFIAFCKRHHDAVLGRRVNLARLEFLREFVFPPDVRDRKRQRVAHERPISGPQVLPDVPTRTTDQIEASLPFKPAGTKVARSKAAHAS